MRSIIIYLLQDGFNQMGLKDGKKSGAVLRFNPCRATPKNNRFNSHSIRYMCLEVVGNIYISDWKPLVATIKPRCQSFHQLVAQALPPAGEAMDAPALVEACCSKWVNHQLQHVDDKDSRQPMTLNPHWIKDLTA